MPIRRVINSALVALCIWGLVWGLADRSPGESPADKPRFSEHLISGDCTYAFGVAAADLDGDGDLDLTSADALGEARTIRTADFDGDGRIDIAACAERGSLELRWWRNEGPIPAQGK